MAAELLTDLSRATDANANALSGAKWHFYATGGLTPQSVYTTAALSVAHANPVVADSGGQFAPIYFDASLQYRGVLKTAGGTTLQDIDPINSGSLSLLAGGTGGGLIGLIRSATGAVIETLLAWWRSQDVSIKGFGASTAGTGTANAAAIQAAINHAATEGLFVYIPNGRFPCSRVQIKPGMKGIRGPGWLVGTDGTVEAVVTCDEAVDDVSIKLNVDGDDVARRGFFGRYLTNSRVHDGSYTGFSIDGYQAIAIYFPDSQNVSITDNNVQLPEIEYGTYPNGLFGIAAVSETTDSTGGYTVVPLGTFKRPTLTSYNIYVDRNRVVGGTHGLQFFGVEGFRAMGNSCHGQRDRNIIISPSCRRFSVTGNDLTGAGSAAIQTANGSFDGVIEGNTIDTTTAAADAADDCAIQTVGCWNIHIGGNTINGDWRWGTGVVSCANIRVSGNIYGPAITEADIIVESGYAGASPPGGATYARARAWTGTEPIILATSGAVAADTSGTVNVEIDGNMHASTTPCSVALYQYGTRVLQNVHIRGANQQKGDTVDTHTYANDATKVTNVTTDRFYTGTNALDIPSIAAGGTQKVTVAVTGAVMGDYIGEIGINPALPDGVFAHPKMVASDFADVFFHNSTAGALDPSATSVYLRVRKRLTF